MAVVMLSLVLASIFSFVSSTQNNDHILSHVVNLKTQDLQFYWKNDSKKIIGTFENLKKQVTKKGLKLRFAMNGGMYQKDQSPQGLYIENGTTKSKINKVQTAYGNFYMQPNGIFYITNDSVGVVCKTTNFKNQNIKYATQSGPMLIIDSVMHPKFMNGSKNLHIRNGVGILPDGKVLFAMSKNKINFYDFASYFMSMGCKNALYLDGAISKTYLPEKNWITKGGNFGVIIGETVAR